MKLINDPTKHVIKDESSPFINTEQEEKLNTIDYSNYTKLTENLEKDWEDK